MVSQKKLKNKYFLLFNNKNIMFDTASNGRALRDNPRLGKEVLRARRPLSEHAKINRASTEGWGVITDNCNSPLP